MAPVIDLTAVVEDLIVELTPQQTQDLQGDFRQVYPVTGTLEITAEDGSRILLDAATGDSATVSITIENSYETIAVMSEWSTWDADLRLDEVGQ